MTTHTDDDFDPIRRIALDTAADTAPLCVTGRPDFDAFCAVADDLADDLERQLRAEVPA
jgi:hypothetical protein